MESVDFLAMCTSSLFYEPRKKKASPILLKSSARLSPGKDQPARLTWLDGSRASEHRTRQLEERLQAGSALKASDFQHCSFANNSGT
jgi:hypothetical protein